MVTKFEIKATGGELFKTFLIGGLLTSVTFGVYYPWFLVRVWKLLFDKSRIHVGDRELRLSYNATGGQLFKELIVCYLLTLVTFGIYMPWTIVRLVKFQQEHTIAASDDRSYRLRTGITGGDLFKTGFVGYLLTAITFGVYMPWFFCKLAKLFTDHTRVVDEEGTVGMLRFNLKGGELFKTFLVGYLLTMITMGIYGFWFQVKLFKLFLSKTEVRISEQSYTGEFTATGGDAFKTIFVGYLLTMITFGVYMPWFVVRLLKFQWENIRFRPAGDLPLEDEPDHDEPLMVIEKPVTPEPQPVRRGSPVPAPAPARARVVSASPAEPPRAARKASTPKLPERTEQDRPAPARASNRPRSSNGGDRRAPWAQSFLPTLEAEATTADLGSEAHETLPHAMTIQELANEVWTDSLAARSPAPRASSVN